MQIVAAAVTVNVKQLTADKQSLHETAFHGNRRYLGGLYTSCGYLSGVEITDTVQRYHHIGAGIGYRTKIRIAELAAVSSATDCGVFYKHFAETIVDYSGQQLTCLKTVAKLTLVTEQGQNLITVEGAEEVYMHLTAL